MTDRPVLLLAAHGTRSAAGLATTHAVRAAVAAALPDVEVELGFLDVVGPSFSERVDAQAGREMVVVPLLLSAGYHVLSDIPAIAAGRPGVLVTRHLGPDPLLTDALVGRLTDAGTPADAAILLVSVGSSRPESRADLDGAAALLADRLGRPVTTATMGGDVRAAVDALPRPAAVASYVLAEGTFLTGLRAAAGGGVVVADAIGTHPALIELILQRYRSRTPEA